MTIDPSKFWDYSQPELSEQRFLAELTGASVGDTLILQTQIARTYGLRGNFSQARHILDTIEPDLPVADAEVQAYYYLELGRTYTSATHPAELQTDEARVLARSAYLQAFRLAQAAGRDDLAIDALHMMIFVDVAPEAQLKWNYQVMAIMQASSQPGAKKWEGALHINTGYTLYQLGRYDETLLEFQLALAARERLGEPGAIRIAWWMIAWTLRALNHLEEALEIQLRLEQECDEAGAPDLFVFEELEQIYRALDQNDRADTYAARRASL